MKSTLQFYDPRTLPVLAEKAAYRPYRQAGVRVQKEVFLDKTYIHNYGHGGAGLSIAWGTCLKAASLIPQGCKQVAVLGYGIVGITTAIILLEKGLKVTVYAQKIPFQKAELPELATTVALGYWMPLKIGKREDCIEYAKTTWHHYELVAKQQTESLEWGLSKLKTYIVNDKQHNFSMVIPGIIEPREQDITVQSKKVKALTFQTYVIQFEKYFKYLEKRIDPHRHRFSMVRARLTPQLLGVKQNVIVNCTGLGSKNLFKDSSHMKGIKGHALKFKLPRDHFMQKFVLVVYRGQEPVLHVPQPSTGCVGLGISFEEGKEGPEVQTETIKRIFDNAVGLFKGQIEATL